MTEPSRRLRRLAAALALAAALPLSTAPQAAPRKTVCTITVNSPDEKESFRRWLPPAQWDFIELVERDRPDWLASACRGGLRCDVLIISGHFDGANEFFSDRVDVNEHLSVAELERASCSASCPALFADLEEVYLFGCNTLNASPLNSTSAAWMRSLVRERRDEAPARATPDPALAESGRDRMRMIFPRVPVIYGFSSFAPAGPAAAAQLERWFRGAGAPEVGEGRPSRRLLQQFAPFGLVAVEGADDADELATRRGEMCAFADERRTPARQLGFVRLLLQREPARSGVHLDRMLRLVESIGADRRRDEATARALAAITTDDELRTRWLDVGRAIAIPAERVRLLRLARGLGWLDDAAHRRELVQTLVELQSRPSLGLDDLELACTLGAAHRLDEAYAPARPAGAGAPAAVPDGAAPPLAAPAVAGPLRPVPGRVDGRPPAANGPAHDTVAHAAVRACLGQREAHERLVSALMSDRADDARVAQAYLRQRPIGDAAELRRLAAAIARLASPAAQGRAIDALGRLYLADRETLDTLARLYADTRSPAVQAAVAGALIRADLRALDTEALARTIETQRRASAESEAVIDALLRRLQPP